MNEFTKEELVLFSKAMRELWFNCSRFMEEHHLKSCGQLESKLQSLIDNYCEHESTHLEHGRIHICDSCNEEV